MADRRPRLEGKVAIVTGAGATGNALRIGEAMSILFAREGCRVVVEDKIKDRAENTRDTIEKEGGQAVAFEGDVTVAEDCRRMVEATVNRFGKLDILVNNVGGPGRGDVVNLKEEDWDRIMDLNVKSILLTGKYAVPRMVQNGGGSIINLSSTAGIRPGRNTANLVYATSKTAVVGATLSMAVHHGPDKIRVNCIAPGNVAQVVHKEESSATVQKVERFRHQATPLGADGTPWDIAWAAVFLASDEARWITGALLPVEGGVMSTSSMTMYDYLQRESAQT